MEDLTKYPTTSCERKYEAETIEHVHSVADRARVRTDEWAKRVFIRIQNVGDLPAAEAKYHHSCQIWINAGKEKKTDESIGRPANKYDKVKPKAL